MIEPDALLMPISADMPQGADPRNPNRIEALNDMLGARREARKREDDEDPDRAPDWARVESLCADLLVGHCKDLEAAAALAEAAIRNDGFSGLAAAGTLVAGLARRFWPALYPAPYPDRPPVPVEDARLAPLREAVKNEGRLMTGIHREVLFALDDGTAFTLANCARAKAWSALRPEERSTILGKLPPNTRAEREKSPNGRIWGDLPAAMGVNAKQLLVQNRDDAAAALQAWRDGAAAINEQAGEGTFSSPEFLALLEEVVRTLSELAPVPTPAPVATESVADQSTDHEQMTGPGAPQPAQAGRLATRDDALVHLEDIAAFFRRTEPFSPMAYMLDEAVRRGRLPWPAWLAEAVPDKMQRDAILQRLGLRPEEG